VVASRVRVRVRVRWGVGGGGDLSGAGGLDRGRLPTQTHPMHPLEGQYMIESHDIISRGV
jgi:hypothetical protein